MKGNIKFVIFNISSQQQKKGLAIFQKKKTFYVNSHKRYCNQSFGSLMSLCNFGKQL
jgi:hypothetical protein